MKIKESEELKREEKGKEKENNEDKNQEKNTNWFLIIITAFVIGVFLFIWVGFEAKKFDYIGLTFQKEKFGEIPIYTTHVTGFGVNGNPIDFKVNLRNDPRDNNVPVIGTLNYIPGKPVYISLNMNSTLHECGSLPLVSLGQFMSGMGFKTITGISTKEKAEEFDRPYITCVNTLDSTVIFLTEGEKSEIRQLSSPLRHCYVATVKKTDDVCELEEVIERLEIASLSSFTGKRV